MFANAYKLASCFTQPLIVSMHFYDDSVRCNGGAFVILNSEGWIITVAHLWKTFQIYQQHTKELRAYDQQLKAIQQDQSLTTKQRNKKLRQMKPNPGWIIDHSFWWGRNGVLIKDVRVLPEGDILIGRLEPFKATMVKTYPVIKDPSKDLNPGTSLCKLGFPFHELNASWDKTKNCFVLAKGVLPVPRFPIEGIYTRNAVVGRSKDGKYEIKLLETSSPGLRGQSGGPIFDINGTVWAIQSRTSHFALGFNPKVKKNGKEVEENQFLNVGLGIHPELLVAFLTDNGISFNVSDY
jgi:hypothetical protein